MNKVLKTLKHNLDFLKDNHKTKFRHGKTKLGPYLSCEIRPNKKRFVEWRFTLYEKNHYLSASLTYHNHARKNKQEKKFYLSEITKGKSIPGLDKPTHKRISEVFAFTEKQGTVYSTKSPDELAEVYADIIRNNMDHVVKHSNTVFE